MIENDQRIVQRDLSLIIHPRNVAVVGASNDRRKLSGRLVTFLRRENFKGQIYLVNKKSETIDGMVSYRSVNLIPNTIDLAVVCIGAEGVSQEILSWDKQKVANIIVISSGFREIGTIGQAREIELVENCKKLGIGLIGPNCLGLISAFDGLAATFSQYADQPITSGPIAFVSQSGAFGTAIASLARERDLGLGYFINTGNEAMLGVGEMLMEGIKDPRISVGAAYFEGVSDGAKLITSMIFAAEAAKPLIFMKVGRSQRGAKAAISHTGALAGDSIVFDGVCRQFGAIQVRDEVDLLDVANAFVTCNIPTNAKLGIATLSGGAGVLMTDLAESFGLELAELSNNTSRSLKELLPEFGSYANPVDVTAQAIADPDLFERAITLLINDLNVGIVIVWIQLLENAVSKISSIFRKIRNQVNKPLLISWIAGPDQGIRALRGMGYPVYSSGTAAMVAAKALAKYSETLVKRDWGFLDHRKFDKRKYILNHIPQNEVVGFEYLKKIEVPIPNGIFLDSMNLDFDKINQLNTPLVVKVVADGLQHKTDVGGVALGLCDLQAVQRSIEDISNSVRRSNPEVRVSGFLVQEMYQPSGRVEEMVVGLKNDPAFGMLVMVGFGGITIEYEHDIAFRKAPINELVAKDMITELRGSYRLGSFRGLAALNIDSLCNLIVEVSRIGEANSNILQGFDINPVLLDERGVMVVDCLFV